MKLRIRGTSLPKALDCFGNAIPRSVALTLFALGESLGVLLFSVKRTVSFTNTKKH